MGSISLTYVIPTPPLDEFFTLYLPIDMSPSNILSTLSINWGNGVVSSNFPQNNYYSGGTFTVSIDSGNNFLHYGLAEPDSASAACLTAINAFDLASLTNFSYAFRDCTQLTSVPATFPSTVSTCRSMFSGCNLLNASNISNWNMSNVTNLSYMFSNCFTFNQTINSWTVQQVTTMSNMLSGCNAFNQPMDQWLPIGNVTTTTEEMFYGCSVFNQAIGGWQMSSVVDTALMFYGCSAFNQNLNTWDVSQIGYMNAMFFLCTDFNQPLSLWNVGNATNMDYMFYGCAAFNQDIHAWDVSSVVLMSSLFAQCTAFDQNLSEWNVSQVTDMNNMLDNTGLSALNYTELLFGWSSRSEQPEVLLGAQGLSYFTVAQDAHDILSNEYNWYINDNGPIPTPLFLTYILPTPFDDFTLPIDPLSITGPWSVNWGDGQTDTSLIHTYDASGTYFVQVSAATLPHLGIIDTVVSSAPFLQSVVYWGDLQTTDLSFAFNGASTLVQVPNTLPTDINPLVPQITDMSEMFLYCTSFNQDLNGWDVSSVENMQHMFAVCANFNGNISSWDVSSVKFMSYMFSDCSIFNQDLKEWDVSSVQTMIYMFTNCFSFNQDISQWNVSSVQNMFGMFAFCVSFNQDLSQWDVSSAQDMIGMFAFCVSFNQDLSQWDVSSAQDMGYMFLESSSFNQDLSQWDVSSVYDMTEMFNGSGLSTVNYSKILIGWSLLPELQLNVPLEADQTHYYSFAQPYRDVLTTAPYTWQINDLGPIPQDLIVSYGNTLLFLNEYVELVPFVEPAGFSFTDFDITPSLPSALTLNTVTGIISGEPAVLVKTTYTVTCTMDIGTPQQKNMQKKMHQQQRWLARDIGPPTVTFTFKLEVVCRYPNTGCPPKVLPKPNMWFNGNTNIPTVQKTNAFRYSWLVSNRTRNNGRNVYLNNPPSAANSGPPPPRNSF